MKKIEKLYAAITDNGIFAIESRGSWYPVVFSEHVKVAEAIKHLKAFSTFAKIEITLAEFTCRKDIEVIKPDEKK